MKPFALFGVLCFLCSLVGVERVVLVAMDASGMQRGMLLNDYLGRQQQQQQQQNQQLPHLLQPHPHPHSQPQSQPQPQPQLQLQNQNPFQNQQQPQTQPQRQLQNQNENPFQNQHQQHPQSQSPFKPYPSSEPQSAYPFLTNLKQKQPQSQVVSDDEEAQLNPEDGVGEEEKRLSSSPWQRMKWTDDMIRLLIMAVHYIGDDSHPENSDPSKKKSVGMLQKKGKWKSVSNAMMSKGCIVSPQQCEDKFNDLNKRYKRLNDILGKGIACDVVANPRLLDSMGHISSKFKEEVRKLLSSKHLFFKEMCAYHNNGFVGACGATSDDTHLCKVEGLKLVNNKNDDNNGENGDDNTNIDDEETEELRKRKHDDDEEDDDEGYSNKVMKEEMVASEYMLELHNGVMSGLLDGTKTPSEQRQWLKRKLLEMEEVKVGYQCQAYELERHRMKWLRYCAEKEQELERKRLQYQRMKFETDRLVLLLRRREFEMNESQQSQQQAAIKRSDSVPIPK